MTPLCRFAVGLIAFALVACAPSPSSAPTGDGTPQPTPTPVATPEPTLAALTTADLGDGDWTLIAKDTFEGEIAHVEVLANIQGGAAAWALSCTGSGTVQIRFGVAPAAGSDPAATATPIATETVDCPATTRGDLTTTGYEGGTWSLNPSVQAPPGVHYRLIVGEQTP